MMRQPFITRWLSGPVTKYQREINRFRIILRDARYDNRKVKRTWCAIEAVLSGYVKAHIRFSPNEIGLQSLSKSGPRLGPDSEMDDADLMVHLGVEEYAPASKLFKRHGIAVLAIIALHDAARGNGRGVVKADRYLSKREDVLLRPDAIRGQKIVDAARLGHEAVHGTAEQKKERYADNCATVERLRAENPRFSHRRLCALAAAEHCVSLRTIQRHVPKRRV
jgi:hypothetical protein